MSARPQISQSEIDHYFDGWALGEEGSTLEKINAMRDLASAGLAHYWSARPTSPERGEAEQSGLVQIGELVEIPDGDEHQANTVFVEWNGERYTFPAGTKVYAIRVREAAFLPPQFHLRCLGCGHVYPEKETHLCSTSPQEGT